MNAGCVSRGSLRLAEVPPPAPALDVVRRGALALAALAVATLALAARADAFVYWADLNSNSIGRASLDGKVVEPFFISLPPGNAPAGVAVNGQYIYWANTATAAIGRADLDGSNVNQSLISNATAQFDFFGVAADDTYLYWGNDNIATIGRANLAGAGADPSFLLRRRWHLRGVGDRRVRPGLLGKHRGRQDRARQPRWRQLDLHHRAGRALGGGGRRRPRLLGGHQNEHDRARQPRRHRRQPELYHRR